MFKKMNSNNYGPKNTIKKNLKRRSEVVDIVPIHRSVPMPTWVELGLIDVCNENVFFALNLMKKSLQILIKK